ncbi:PIH1 domain-containing protein 2-like [Styela clava]
MDSKEMKNQAEYIWNRLDDLAKNDPDAYKKFIEKQMEEQKIFTSSPEPRICLQTKALGNESEIVFINICAWKKIPYPETEDEPVKLFAGMKTSKKLKNGQTETVLPVAINDKLYEECTDTDLNKNALFGLILNLTEDTLKTKISRDYRNYKELYKGDLPADPRTLFITNSQIQNEKDILQMAQTVNSPEDLLKKLSMNEKTENGLDTAKIDTKFEMDELLGKRDEKKSKNKKDLIQEIKETNTDFSHLPRPEHTLTEMPKYNERPAKFVLKIKLPTVSSVAECDLNISEESVELIVEDKYYFTLTFPSAISEDDASAKFNKKTSCLTLNVPLK